MLVEKYKRRGNDRGAGGRWASSVIFNLALLFFFKYWDFIAANLSLIPGIDLPQLGIPLPIGISFYTFQTMSYTIDVYRKDAPVQRNMVDFGAFVDIGVHQDGLVHISQLADRRVRHPSDVVAVGDVVEVTVLSVDEAKKRISLTMRKQ